MVKKCFAILLLLVALLPAWPAQAADMLISNYSFESGLASWTQTHGTGGIAVSTEQAYSGTYSVKMEDASTTASYGLQSGYLPATAGKSYYAFAYNYLVSGGVDLYLRFYNSSYTLIGSEWGSKSAPLNEWTRMKVGGVAPPGTAYVAVLLYSGVSGKCVSYWDDIMISADLTNIGGSVISTAIRSATFALDGSGQPAFYLGVNGSTGNDVKMVEVNANTGAVQKIMPLPGTTYAHSAATTIDNQVYMGTYPNGYLFKYSPGASAPVNLGKAIPDATYILALTPGSTAGKVYGGTYPNSGVFKYEPTPGFYTFSPHPFVAGSQYSYSIAYDSPRNVLYVGSGGTKAQIARLENSGGHRNDDLIPAVYANANTAVVSLDYEAGKLFARLSPEDKTLVMDVTKNADGSVTVVTDAYFPTQSKGVSPARNGKVYYSAESKLQVYDTVSKTSSVVLDSSGNPITMAAYAYGWAHLADTINYPGESLVVVGHSAGTIRLYRYNPTTGKSSDMLLTTLPGTPSDISTVVAGPDGKIYTGGLLTGNLGVYTPLRSDQNKTLFKFPQLEGGIASGNSIYFGGYPGASIYKYNVADDTQSFLFFLDDLALQERPFGMAQGAGKLFVGTVPTSGQNKGALTIVDTATGTPQIFRDIVPNQSIVSVAYHDGYVYAGSAIGGGKNTSPIATEAKLVKMNVATGAYTTYTMPVSSQGITALTVGRDNKIWGLSEGYLFVFNPVTNTIEYHSQKFTDVNYTTTQTITQDGSLVPGRAGSNRIFGTIKNHFFEIDMATKTVTTRFNGSSDVRNAVADESGDIYFRSGNNLYRWMY